MNHFVWTLYENVFNKLVTTYLRNNIIKTLPPWLFINNFELSNKGILKTYFYEIHKWSRLHKMTHRYWPLFGKFMSHEILHTTSIGILVFKIWECIWIPIWGFYKWSGLHEMMWCSCTSFWKICFMRSKAPHKGWNASFQNPWAYLNTNLGVSQVA